MHAPPLTQTGTPADALAAFHPAVRAWFERTHGDPSECQAQGWPAIAAGQHTLIAAPTGSGKTLAAFLAAIDTLVRQGLEMRLPDEVQVLYISPLKALSNDIQRNLQAPLQGVQAELAVRGLPSVPIRTVVRTGDTPASERAAMTRRPPHILVTTPESLFILLTSVKGRRMLSTVRTVIVDEIHTLVESKRGAHLALSLERLETLTRQPPIEIPARRADAENSEQLLLTDAAQLEPRAQTSPGLLRSSPSPQTERVSIGYD